MVSFGHTAIGAGIGVLAYSNLGLKDPVIGLALTTGLGIMSHYAADLLPHGHFFKHNSYKKMVKWVIIFDLFLSILIYMLAAYLVAGLDLRFWYILFGIAGSQAPDVLDGLMYIGLIKNKGLMKKEYQFHQLVHWHGEGYPGKGLPWKFSRDIYQITLFFVGLVLVFNLT